MKGSLVYSANESISPMIFFHCVVVVLAAVEVGVFVGEFAEQDGVPAGRVESAFDFVVIAFFDVEKVKVLAKHGGLHQLGDRARAARLVEKEDGVGAAFNHLLLFEDDLLAGKLVGGEEIRSHVSHLRADEGVARVHIGKESGRVLQQYRPIVFRYHLVAVRSSSIEAERAAAKEVMGYVCHWCI